MKFYIANWNSTCSNNSVEPRKSDNKKKATNKFLTTTSRAYKAQMKVRVGKNGTDVREVRV